MKRIIDPIILCTGIFQQWHQPDYNFKLAILTVQSEVNNIDSA